MFKEGKLSADWKSALPAILQPNVPFWQREYWDRFIRDEVHYHRAIRYIHENPAKAKLCKDKSDWLWSSFSEYTKRSAD